jgi:sterol desaturase/sphingolipid hydroxylase (fatty acid hydroxylase superfamily)
VKTDLTTPPRARPFDRRGRRNSTARAGLLSYVAYPLLLLGAALTAQQALTRGWALGPVTFATVLGTMAYLALLERMLPYRDDWHPTRAEWGRDGLYFSMSLVVGALAQAALSALPVSFASTRQVLPLWLEMCAALLISTFFTYWFHRIGHVSPWMWKVHGVHHVPRKVNLANNNVVQIIDTFGANLVPVLPLLLLGCSEQALFLVSVVTAVQGFGSHCNADVRLGWLNYLICGPEQHRLHHGLALAEAGHFGVDVSLWDHVFGSFTWRPGKQVERVGVLEPASFPPETALLANQLHPFRRARRAARTGSKRAAGSPLP